MKYGEPGFEAFLLISAARRDYFFHIQKGTPPPPPPSIETLPSKTDEISGIPWLPRILVKARCKLAGNLPDDIMYGCGGDRKFLRDFDVHPAEFLRVVWAAKDDDRFVVRFLQQRRQEAATGG